MKNKKGMLINHYDVLAAFKDAFYKDLITKDNLGDETVIKVNDMKEFIYPVKYKGKIFAIPSELVVEAGKLPIKIIKSVKHGYNRNVYHLVKKFVSAKIRDDKAMSFRGLVDALADFEHPYKDTDFLVYKITMIMLYLRKGFVRVASEPAFGKTCIPKIIKPLMRDIAVTNPRTSAAFEHKLMHDMIVLDELTNLEKSQRKIMQEALLQVADGSSSYEKGTRMSAKLGTKDEYDISRLSIAILYNELGCYLKSGSGDEYFDFIFQDAVYDRFLPLHFRGVMNSMQFARVDNPKKVAMEYNDDIKKNIRALKHYKKNFELYDKKHFKLNKEYILSESGRIDKTFHVICQGLRTYSNTEEEYNKLTEVLYQAHVRYKDMIQKNEVEEIPLEEIEKNANKSL